MRKSQNIYECGMMLMKVFMIKTNQKRTYCIEVPDIHTRLEKILHLQCFPLITVLETRIMII